MNPFGFFQKLPGVISGGVKTGIRKLGEIDDGADGGMLKPPMPRTGPGGSGGFAGNEGLPQIGGNRGLINRPEPMPTAMPQLARPEMPKLEPIRDGASVSANLPMGDAEASPLSGQMIAERPVVPVRPPDFLGRKGATMDDTPLNHERYAYENQYMQEGRHPRRWQDIAMTALHGANEGFKATGDWRGAVAGAGTGAAGAAISPQGARRFRFDREQLPGITASRQEMERGQDRSFEMQKRGADLEGLRARTNATIAGTKDAELERRKTEGLIKLNEAKRQAVESGQAKIVEIEDENGQVRIVRVNNDGTVDLGASGKAAMNQDRIESREKISSNQIKSREGIVDKQIGSREKIVGQQQSGANYRAGMSQSGQNARQAKRLSAQYGDAPPVGSVPVKRATAGDVQEYARQKGISPAEAKAKFEAKGYRVE